MSAPLSTKALSLLSHIREGKIETAKAIILSKIMGVADNEGYTRRELEVATGLTSGSVTGRLNELVKGGLIVAYTTAVDAVTDKRVNVYIPTAEAMRWKVS